MNSWTEASLKQLCIEIYHFLIETDSNVIEIWCELSDIPFLRQLNNSELRIIIGNLNFLSFKKGNYIQYIVINKISFIIEAINIIQLDIRKLTEIINYDGFEALIKEILSKNNYVTTKNFRFSDKSYFKSETSQKRYEIDIIGIFFNYILLIDAKQWKRKDSFSSINKAADLQYRRAIALKKNPEIFSMLIQKLLGNNLNLRKRLPFILIPIIVTLEENSIKMNNNQIPLVSVYQLNSFLHELQNNLHYFKIVSVNKVNIQKRLF